MYIHDNNDYTFYYRAKHPVQVHVWDEISLRGCRHLYIFEGEMDALMCEDIPGSCLKPFIDNVYPDCLCKIMTLTPSNKTVTLTILHIRH